MKLALFFTFGVSLKQWLDKGLFDREKLLYEELLHKKILSKVLWFTYGCKDEKIAEQLKQGHRLHSDIQVIQMPAFFNFPGGKYFYSLLMPLMMKKFLKDADVLKTNQMSGSWSAVIARKIFKQPLIVRTGYTWSRLKSSQETSGFKNTFVRKAEAFAYKNADFAVVTTKSQAEFIQNRYSVAEKNIFVIPNYIDTNLFKPDGSAEKYTDRLIYVGRISNEKNLFNLVTAAAKANMQLGMYGSGSLMEDIRKYSQKVGVRVEFKGSVANNLLPQILNGYRFFVLPSLHESLPKSLLEAMACGLVCIGTDVTGINEIITDGVNGWLAKGTDPDSIFEAVERAKNNPGESISRSAVETIKNKFSLENIVKKYSQLLARLENEC
jgi:glycosyltransferase involved in cell wall biosynthesis